MNLLPFFIRLWKRPSRTDYITLDIDSYRSVINANNDVWLTPSELWRQSFTTIALSLTVTVLFLTNLLQSLYLFNTYRSTQDFKTYNGAGTPYYVERRGYVPTKYMSTNETEAAAAWAAIQAGHGIVALDAQWAAARNLPSTHVWREDPSKLIYGIEAYHAMHCVRTIRAQYMSLLSDEKPLITWDTHHTRHCFDSLRQYVMCTADDTLLQSYGHAKIGVNQTRQCRDWDALRDFATRHAAGYDDNEQPPGGSRWGHDDFGSDGLPVGTLLE